MAPRVPWYRQRHANAAAFRPFRPESSFKGTITCTLFEYFKPERNWMIVPEIILRDVIATRLFAPVADVPYAESLDDLIPEDAQSDELDDESFDAADLSVESQGGLIIEDRVEALRPDFGVAKAQSELFSDRNHLYVEVKNGEIPATHHGTQMVDYANAIASAIPPNFGDHDVILMLVHAATTYFWRINPTSLFELGNIWKQAEIGRTHGYKMNRVLKEVSMRG